MKKYALVLSLAYLIGCLWTNVASAETDFDAQNDTRSVTLSGRLEVMWGDPPPDSGLPHKRVIFLFDDAGNATHLLVDDELFEAQIRLPALNGKRVTVSGVRTDLSGKQIWVDSITLEEGEPAEISGTVAAALTGSQPWVTILCRFSDSTGTTPETPTWFRTLMGAGYPGMDYYWRRVSDFNIDLIGSSVVGWYNLPNPRSNYIRDTDGDGTLDLDFQRALNDCAAAADDDVDFTNYAGAMWVPGEGFLDTGNGVLVFVESETDTGFVVSITTSPRDPTYADRGNTGDEDGSSANPWNTMNEGMAGVIPGGTIFGAPGNYPGGVTLRKPLTLQRWGSSGSVVIGG